MFDKMKERIFLVFTISLVASYFACTGYYLYFNTDISSFLTIEDIVMIFAKWIWLTSIFSVFLIYLAYKGIKKMGDIGEGDGWWDQTIGRSIFKRRVIVVLPLVLAVLVYLFFSNVARDVLSALFGVGFIVIILISFVLTVVGIFKQKKNLEKIQLKDWVLIGLAVIIFIYVVPAVGGMVAAANLPKENITIEFADKKIINTRDSINLVYIGKTHDNIFIFNSKTKKSTVYQLGEILSIETGNK